MKITAAQAQTVTCPNCNAQPGRRCNQPTNSGRRDVAWVHLAREDAYRTARTMSQPACPHGNTSRVHCPDCFIADES